MSEKNEMNMPVKPEGVYTGDFEPKKQRKKMYNYEELVKTLKAGKKYLLPSSVKTTNTVYQIRKKLLNDEKIENVNFATAKSLKQFVLFVETEKK